MSQHNGRLRIVTHWSPRPRRSPWLWLVAVLLIVLPPMLALVF